MNKDYAIEVKGLRKAYKDKQVLKDVNFQVEEGEIFCLLGSNGSGKTTTVKILSTLLEKDAGTAYVCGYDVVHEDKEVRNVIRMTGQFAAVDEILSGRENLEMAARLHHIKTFRKAAEQLLEAFHLEDAADKRASMYSGGMKRRLDIAMSLLGTPSVIFLDEPTTGLDPQSRNAMWKMVKDLKERGVTIFLTTQYLEEAEQLADHVAILHHGVIIAQGSVEDMKTLASKEYLTFTLFDKESYEIMRSMFETSIVTQNEQELCITIEVKDGIRQVTNIFSQIQAQQVQVASFQQKKASLEDVFLYLVEDEKGHAYV